ncbi:nucleotide exchange factor GrpE [Streptomyces sp. NBS 14/10]|uniref:nucleotide exchange factor GrpE n=1 Tax=Streptomyces sp. NBS 14/10 TaxID=1945643 RepID=UPI000B7FBCD6|nr:nucleotide exchange factor GrpE [Streptomyces sp. NBS 14/10]KAK1185073.1 nucleotide exchange factor GrpE [Streptomyces sp. NBS 14/10]NUP44545.1 nucleotide exchange factor GrpE [Streptomyces sp.]NUS85971.1 nucleotide exchange factor GrpE [Streptomyces sp.]
MSHRPQEPEPVPEGAVPEPEQDLPAPGTAEARGAGGEGPGPDAAGGPAPPEDEYAAALAELEDRWRRTLADLDNLRKRHARELERERAAERARTATALLPVIDNLELALSHAEADPATIVEGVRAVRDQAVDALARLGYARQDETGVPFDPARHEVVGVVDDPEAEPGTVVQVLRPGYGDTDNQLRPMAVAVAKRE